jgi:ribonuclease R
MLATNEAVADFLHGKHLPFIRRVHMPPSLRKLRAFADFVRSLEIADLRADDMLESRFVIQKLLDKVKGTQQELAVNFSLLRSMQKAIYSPDTEGHYALASSCYAHFTSPIRRYPDLSIHRLLDKVLSGETPKPELRELVLLAEHCSEREQRAEEAERQLVKLKLIDYMSQHIGDKLEAVVTGVETFGGFVMGVAIPAEGLIRLEALTDDIYRFDRNLKILTGNREGSTLRIGDRLLVEVVRADVDSRQIDFRLVKRLKTDKKTAAMKRRPIKRLQKKR